MDQLAAGSSASEKNIVFIDTSVADYQQIVSAVPADDTVVLIDGSQDGIAQITNYLATATNVGTIHIVSHGSDGELSVGTSTLTSDNLDQYTSELSSWSQALAPGADVLLYGCSIAADGTGQALVSQIAGLTGATVAASTDLTGSTDLGGNWNLEYATGPVAASTLSDPGYEGVLSHFRAASLSWAPGTGNSVTFTMQVSFREDYTGYTNVSGKTVTNPQVGAIINVGGATAINFGDNTTAPVYVKVTAINTAGDYFVGDLVSSTGAPLTHTYAGKGPYTASWEDSARLSTLVQFHDDYWRTQTVVDPGTGNSPPASSLPPIVQVADNSVVTFQIPAVDPDGDPLTYAVGTASQFISASTSILSGEGLKPDSGNTVGTVIAPAGLTVSSTGLVTWDIRNSVAPSVTPGQLYAMTVTVTDHTSSGAVKSTTPLDFILQVVDTTTSKPPTFTIVPPAQVAFAGIEDDQATTATDPQGGLVNMQVLNPLTGMSSVYHSDEGELHINFLPTAAEIGTTSVVNVQALDNLGLTANASITYQVVSPAPTVKPNATAQVAEQGQQVVIGTAIAAQAGDQLVVTRTDGGTSGTLSLVPVAGGQIEQIVYTAASGSPVRGPDAVSYSVTDTTLAALITDHTVSASTRGTATVTLDPGPTATAGAAVTVGHDMAKDALSIIRPFITPGLAGDTETVTSITSSAGTVSHNAVTGAWTYTSPSNGPDTLTYTVQDELGGTAQGTVAVTVDPGPSSQTINSPAFPHDAIVTQAANASWYFTPGLPGDTLTITGVSSASGRASLASDGQSFTYDTPSSGTDTLSLTAMDQYGDTATNTYNVVIDTGPVAASGSLTVGHNTTQDLTTLVNSLVTPGLAGDTETISAISAQSGTASLNPATHALSYTAPASGSDDITYTVQDEVGDRSTGSVHVQVDAGPTTTPGTLIIGHGQIQDVTALLQGLVTPGLPGDTETLVAAGSGRGLAQLANGQVVYTAPSASSTSYTNFPDTIGYLVQDQYGDESAGTVNVVVDGGPTVAASSPDVVEAGQSTVIGSALRGLPNDLLTLTQTGGTAGALTLQADGSILYTAPVAVTASALDNVSYTLTDQLDDVFAGSASVQLDAGPTITAVAPGVAARGQTTVVGIVTPGLAGDTLMVTKTGGAGTLSLSLNPDGTQSVVYAAPASVTSSTDAVTYRVTDQHNDAVAQGSASVQLDPGPTLASATPGVIEQGQGTVVGTVTPGLPGDALMLTETSGAGLLTLGTLKPDGTQDVIYKAPGAVTASGTDAVSYTIADQFGDTVKGAATVQLDAGPTITAAVPKVLEIGESTVVGSVAPGLAGDTLTLTQTGGTAGALTLQADGSILYTAAGAIAASAVDTVTYTVADQHNDAVATGSANVQLDAGPTITAAVPKVVEKGQSTVVGSVAPGLAGDTLTLTQTGGTAGALTLQADGSILYTAAGAIAASAVDTVTYTVADQHNDAVATGSANVQLDAGPTIMAAVPKVVEKGQSTVVGSVAPGLAGDTLTLTQTGGTAGALTLQADGSILYTAAGAIAASAVDTVTYTVADQHNDAVATGSANVQLDAGPTITAAVPKVVEKGQSTVVGSVAPGLAGDTLTLTQTGGTAGALTLQADGTIVYTAAGTIAASAVDAVTYTVADQHNDAVASGSANVQLDAGPTIAAAVPKVVEKGQSTVVGSVAPGLAGDTLTLTQTGGTGALTLQADGTILYTAAGTIAASAVDAVSYTVADQHNDAVATGSANVQLDAGPTITAATPKVVEKGQSTVVGSVAPGLAGDTLTLTQTGGTGALTLQVDGTIVYTAAGTIVASAVDKVSYTVSDQHNDAVATGSANVQLDAGPTITAATPKVVEKGQSTVVGSVAPGLAGDTLTLTQTGGTAGALALQADGTILYTAAGTIAASAVDKASYTVADQHSDAVVTGSANVQLDAGPTAGTVTTTDKLGVKVDLTQAVLAAAGLGLKGDTVKITSLSTSATLGSAALANGVLTYTATGAGLSHIPANGSQADSFGYVITDEYGGMASGTVKLTVTNPASVINGPPYGFGNIQGTTGTDIINAYGWFNTVHANGGNDVINAGEGNATVYTGSGDVVSNLDGYFNTVSGGDGNNTVSGSDGNTCVTLGNGTDAVSIDGFGNTITLGNGNDTVNAGLGSSQVILGGGNDAVTIGGYGNAVTAGNGNNSITGGLGNSAILLGNGNNTVTTSGYGNSIVVGSGSNKIVAGSGATVTAGAGADTITLAGNNNVVMLNGSTAHVAGGLGGDLVTVNGGHDSLTFAGWNDHAILNAMANVDILDSGHGLDVDIGSSTQTDTITGFGTDGAGLIDFKNHAGGFTTAAGVMSALHSDNHGGTILNLGTSGSIDFINTAQSAFHASNFKIG